MKTTIQPTCEKEGVRTYTCDCGKTKTESIPALGHEYKTKTTTTYNEIPRKETWYHIREYAVFNVKKWPELDNTETIEGTIHGKTIKELMEDNVYPYCRYYLLFEYDTTDYYGGKKMAKM